MFNYYITAHFIPGNKYYNLCCNLHSMYQTYPQQIIIGMFNAFCIKIREDDFVPYRPVQSVFIVLVSKQEQKCRCFVSVKIPAVPNLFRLYQDTYQISAGNWILDRNKNQVFFIKIKKNQDCFAIFLTLNSNLTLVVTNRPQICSSRPHFGNDVNVDWQ